MFDKSYFITQALLVLGQPITQNGVDFSGDSKVGEQVFQRAIDELSLKAGVKMVKKKTSLTKDANRDLEFGMLPGDFNSQEAWWILPTDLQSLVNVSVNQYRVSGDHLVTQPATVVNIEYVGTINPAEIPNNMRNLFIYILAKHIAIATRKEEKLQFVESMLQNELIQVKFATPNRKSMDYFQNVKLRRR